MDEFTIFCIGLALLAAFLYMGTRKWKKLPPGPIGLPVLGYYPFLGKDPVKTLTNLGKKYGSVFGLYVGPKYLVVLNDWETMIETYKQASTLYRPPDIFEAVPYNFGIGGANGAEWTKIRRLYTKSVKDIMLHGTRWEKLIQEEVSEVVDRITQHGTGPLDVRSFFTETFANSIMILVLGKRLYAGHPLVKMIARSIDMIFESVATMDMVNFSPRLSKLLQVLGLEEKINLEEEIQEFSKYVSNTVEERLKNPDKVNEDSFIEIFNLDLQNHTKGNADKDYIENAVKGNVVSLLAGGSETTRTTVIFALVAMADYPEEQRKVHEELDRVIGQDRMIQWADKSKIPYTYATLMEVMRWKTLVPLMAMRMAAKDIQVQGYHIPKGTFITFNAFALHNDLKYWDEPEKFIPERFLIEDGKKVKTDVKSFAPFSYGKRMCPGKLVADIELIQYFATLLQKFKVVPYGGDKVQYDTMTGLTYTAYNVKLCFIPR